MITLLTGIPGSGKSYWVVNHLSKLNDHSKILHNVEGLKLGNSLDSFALEKNLSKLSFFKKSFHESNNEFRGWTFVIDEAAELFPKNFKDTDVISFFDYHRHYGIDIFLLTQDIKKVCPDITCLSETHYRAASGASNPIPGFLLYQQIVGGEAVSRKFLRKKKSIFKLYKSASDNSSSTLNIGKVYAVVAIIGIIGFALGMKYWFNSFRPGPANPPPLADPRLDTQKSLHLDTKISKSSSIKDQESSDSLSSVLGGRPYPLSMIRDYSGVHYVFYGQIYRKEYFPFKVVKTRVGEVALLPPDIYAQVVEYDKSLDVLPTQEDKNKPVVSKSETPTITGL